MKCEDCDPFPPLVSGEYTIEEAEEWIRPRVNRKHCERYPLCGYPRGEW
jgi:hypothetical protein